MEIVTVSSRGQVSIPADIRRDLDLEQGSKLLVVAKDDTILFNKIDKAVIDQSFEDILTPLWETVEKEGLDDADAEELVHEHRGGNP